jgi:hypothetical protein
MAAKSKRQQVLQMYGLMAALGAFFFGTIFVAFWMTKPEVVSALYRAVRGFQFFSFWDDLFPQARVMIAETERGRYSLFTLMWSSLPTAILSAVGIATIGIIAYTKVTNEHLDAFITHKSPPSMMAILEKFAILKPSVRFVLDYKDYKLSSAKGAGRLPYHPLHFLQERDFINRVGREDEWLISSENNDFAEALSYPYLDVKKKEIVEYFEGTFGPRNPFLDMANMNDLDEVRKAVDAIQFYMVLVMAPALARVHYSIFYEEKAYVRAVLDLHKFPDEVWAELNAMKKAEGERLRLGFDDEKHRASEDSLWLEKCGKGKKGASAKSLVTLGEYLRETITVGGKEVQRGDTMKTVAKARALMWDVLTMHRLEDRKRWPVGQDDKANFIWTDKPPKTAAERAYMDKVMERLIRASEECNRLVHANAFCFGTLGTLVERTRQMGVYIPNVWRWMRFVEPSHWRFFLDLGKPISSVDSMGMWEHYQTETALETPLFKPYLTRTPLDLARQAARFVTKEFVSGFQRSNVMEETGNLDLDAIYREMEQADRKRKADADKVKSALDVGEVLQGFDPNKAVSKTINFKKVDRRIVS